MMMIKMHSHRCLTLLLPPIARPINSHGWPNGWAVIGRRKRPLVAQSRANLKHWVAAAAAATADDDRDGSNEL